MRISLSTLALILCSLVGIGCQPVPVPERLQTSFVPLNKKLATTVSPDEYAISPTEADSLNNPLFLDARAPEEYQVSHLPGAKRIGSDSPDFTVVAQVDKDRPIVVYCTIGYRSERMANKLRKQGFSKVYNLYGSIYAWSLAGLPLENAQGEPTQKIHTYNKKWGTYFPHDEQKVH